LKYADELVLMAKEETVLHGMIDKLIEIGRCYGIEMNVGDKSSENFKTAIPSINCDGPKPTGEYGIF
jgi:ABC-type cobalamin/Fe3+-siderophores transport system ATPase subunit